MDFAFTEEQEQLRREARSFLSERFPAERVAGLADSEAGWDEQSWAELAELGWLGVSVSEEAGGTGLGFLEEAVLHEELGRALYPGPFFSTLVVLPELGPEEQADAASGKTRWSFTLDGSLVPDLAIVDRVLTGDGSVAAEGETLETMDATRRFGRLTEPAAPAEHLRTRAFAALALEAVGISQRALEYAIEHAKTREQFGKPIGIYQAISHPISDSYVDTELSRSLAYWAAWCVAENDEQAPLVAAAAKARAAEAAVAVCERAIQVHGGIGFTWEHPLHRYYKRAQWIEAFGGYPAVQRAEVARHLVG